MASYSRGGRYLGITGTAFSDYGWSLTNLYWKQFLNQRRISFVVGAVDATDYLDIYGLTYPWTQFQNLVFLTEPTIPTPNPSLGAAYGAMATGNVYVVGGLANSNDDPIQPGDCFDPFLTNTSIFNTLRSDGPRPRIAFISTIFTLPVGTPTSGKKQGFPAAKAWRFRLPVLSTIPGCRFCEPATRTVVAHFWKHQ